jgi:hypothetical protein
MIPDKIVNVSCGNQSIIAEWKDTILPIDKEDNIYWVTVICSENIRLETRMRQEEVIKTIPIVLSQRMTDIYIGFLGKVMSDSYRTTNMARKGDHLIMEVERQKNAS